MVAHPLGGHDETGLSCVKRFSCLLLVGFRLAVVGSRSVYACLLVDSWLAGWLVRWLRLVYSRLAVVRFWLFLDVFWLIPGKLVVAHPLGTMKGDALALIGFLLVSGWVWLVSC